MNGDGRVRTARHSWSDGPVSRSPPSSRPRFDCTTSRAWIGSRARRSSAAAGGWSSTAAPIPQTWLKIRQTADAGRTSVYVDEWAEGWKQGDRSSSPARAASVTAEGSAAISSREPRPRSVGSPASPPRDFTGGYALRLDRPLAFSHFAEGNFRAEVANLTRNVVVESANPDGVRGHTMYHRNSAGSIQLRGVPPPRQAGREGPLQHPLPPGRRDHAGQLGHRGLDLGQSQPLDHDPRHRRPRGPRQRGLQERRPRLFPRERHRDQQHPRPQPRGAGACPASRRRIRKSPSTSTVGPGSGGRTARTVSPGTWPPSAPSTVTGSIPRRQTPTTRSGRSASPTVR